MLKLALNKRKNSRELTICSPMTKLDELHTNLVYRYVYGYAFFRPLETTCRAENVFKVISTFIATIAYHEKFCGCLH